jgi:hypothetical protein
MVTDPDRPEWHPTARQDGRVVVRLYEARLVQLAEDIASSTPDRVVLPSHVTYAAAALGTPSNPTDRSSDVLTVGVGFLTGGASVAAALAVVTVPHQYGWIEPLSIGGGLLGLLLCGTAFGMKTSRRNSPPIRLRRPEEIEELRGYEPPRN